MVGSRAAVPSNSPPGDESNASPPTLPQPAGINNAIITGNIQGLYSRSKHYKIERIRELAIENDAILISLTESHLNENILDAEININGFDLFRQDRQLAQKGGIITYIKDTISSTAKIVCAGSQGRIEYLCIYFSDKDLLFITIYRPPSENHQHFYEVLKKIDEYILSLPTTPSIILTGDFNYPRIRWSNGVATSSPAGTGQNPSPYTLINFADSHFLTQIIEQPTRGRNILDLLFTNNDDIFSTIEVAKTPFLSDHNLILAATTLSKPREYVHTTNPSRNSFKSLNFFHRNINWEAINLEIEAIDWEARFANSDVHEIFETFWTELLKIACKYVPKKKAFTKNKQFIPEDRRKLMKKQKVLRRKIEASRNPSQITRHMESIESIERSLKTSHDNEHKRGEDRAIECMKGEDKNYFFTYANSKKKIKTQIGPFENEGMLIQDPKLKAELLKEQFESVFVPPDVNHTGELPPSRQDPGVTLEDFEITEENIAAQIKELRKKASAGPDDIPAVLLKNCMTSVKAPLCIFWNKSFQEGSIPDILKTGIITPIYKGKDRTKTANYRPVSLTSNVMKIFEKLVRKKITEHMEANELFNPNQHGFRSGRSCISQLLNHHTKILEELELGKRIDVIYLDFAKAFDKVHHGILLNKLQSVGITGKLFEWVKEFLRARKQFVSVEGALSNESDVLSGVPQDTVLGPLLFLIHIGDIDREISNSKVSCFADDTRIMKTIKEDNDKTLLQEDLNRIYHWANTNKMKFNDNKFEMIDYQPGQRNELYHTYRTESEAPIERKSEIRDLGIILNNEATFTEHIATIVKKGKKLAGWALRTFKSREASLMLTLLKVLIRPHLEYGCQVWNPHMARDISLLEKVQRNFTRKIEGTNGMDYWERLRELNLYSLQRRRERYIIIYIWKIINNLVPNFEGEDKIRVHYSDRTGLQCVRPRLTEGRRTRFGTRKENSLVVFGQKLFNHIPKEIRACTGPLETFKRKLDGFLRTVRDQPVLHGGAYPQQATTNSIITQIGLMSR